MHCASCAQNIENNVKKLHGVESISVNLPAETASVVFDESVISCENIIGIINSLGYKAALPTEDDDVKKDEELKSEQRRLIVAVSFAAVLFILAMGPMIGLFTLPQFISNPKTLCALQFILCVPVVVCGRRFYSSGFSTLIRRAPNMDTLIAIGTFSALAYSIYSSVLVFLGHEHMVHSLYFESASMIITLVMLGKFLEKRATLKTSDAVKKLVSLTPATARIIRDDKEIDVKIQDVTVGTIAVVRPGERIPVDGVIVFGETTVDESMITGESMPVPKKSGSEVVGGCINREGYIKIYTSKVGEDTTLAQIVRTVSEAQASKAPIARLADVVAGYFVPIVISIALISAIAWMIAGKEFSFVLSIFISVLVISCPCALGLATPTAIMAGTGNAAEHGILFRNGAALEHASKTKIVVLDKTGTITKGRPSVTDIVSDIDENELMSLAASCESASEHVLAEAIITYANEKELEIPKCDDFKYEVGCGVTASVNGKKVFVGNSDGAGTLGRFDSIFNKLASDGKTPVYVSSDGKAVGVIAISDPLKDNAEECISQLKKRGIDVYMLTGDNENTARAIANEVGIKNVRSNVKPNDKSNIVSELKEGGKTVCMVGDGINDAPALATADVAITVASGTDIAAESSDIVLMKNDLLDIPKVLSISSAVTRNIKQNLFWAFAYNIIGIPFAAGVAFAFGGPLLNPMIAAAAMSLSSITVVLNALRLGRFKI